MRHFANVALKEKETNNCRRAEKKSKSKLTSDAEIITAKKYNDIPGPKGIFGVGTFYQYFPVIGMRISMYFSFRHLLIHSFAHFTHSSLFK